MKSFIRDKMALAAIAIFTVMTVWWVALRLTNAPADSLTNSLFGNTYGAMALFGALAGFFIAKKWGGFKSLIGRAIAMFSLGLLFQEFGQLVYAYFIFIKNVDIPYPSIGDIGYFGSIPLYIYGAYLLAKATGVHLSVKSTGKKAIAVIVPLLFVGLVYWSFLVNYDFAGTPWLTIFLDFGYPLGQAVYISIAIITLLLSRGMLGGLMKNKIRLLLVALVAQFASDYTFLYQSHQGTWTAGGINDYMYLVSYFLMAAALIKMKLAYDEARGQ